MWSCNRTTMKKNSNKYTCKVAGSYSLAENGVDDLYFMENSKKRNDYKMFRIFKTKKPKRSNIIDNR